VGKRSSRRIVEARFFAEGREVAEGDFWRAVERLAGAGYRARIGAEEVRWTLTPQGAAAARLIREREAGR
jgi:hypothetical protein